MKIKLFTLSRFGWIFILLWSGQAFSQEIPAKEKAAIDTLVERSKALIGSDSAGAINLAYQAIDKAKAVNYYSGTGLAYKNIGMIYYRKGLYLETLEYWNKALDAFEKAGDDGNAANILSNIGAVYLNQGADAQALDYNLRSLKIAEKINDTPRMINALSNVGGTYYNKKDPVALTYLLKVLPMIERRGDPYHVVVVTGNIGEVYNDLKEDDKALEYYQKSIRAARDEYSSSFSYNGLGKLYLRAEKYEDALKYHTLAMENAIKFDDNLGLSRSYRGMASYYEKIGNLKEAIVYYNKAKVLGESMDDLKPELNILYQSMGDAYAQLKDFKNAHLYQTLYSALKDSLYNIETKKELNQLQFDFELSKKEAELSIQDERLKSERQARIGITFTVGILLLGSILLYRSYLQKSKINKILDKQKDEIEGLLMNILPKEIAHELQVRGKTDPRHYDEVSVLFTDFTGFTSIADKMTPDALVEELNECFIAFDDIIGSYGLEKIKTIGDSYMCAGNIPSPLADHSFKIIKAGIEIRDFVREWNDNRALAGKEVWDIRIGVHTGPIVAGVVGRRKYAYDIWGSTVNIASRMESSCLPGKVNISASTYDIVKDRFECSYRGKISAKNAGELDMYFVEKEIHAMSLN